MQQFVLLRRHVPPKIIDLKEERLLYSRVLQIIMFGLICMLMQRPKCIRVYAYEGKHTVVFKDMYVNSYTQIQKDEF